MSDEDIGLGSIGWCPSRLHENPIHPMISPVPTLNNLRLGTVAHCLGRYSVALLLNSGDKEDSIASFSSRQLVLLSDPDIAVLCRLEVCV